MNRTAISIAGAVAVASLLTACGDSSSEPQAAECDPVASSLTVKGLDQLTFDADAYDASAGCVEFTYVNEGTVAHSLLIEGQPFELLIGETDVGRIDLAAGTYTLYCDVAGHRAAGMEAELTVAQ